MLSVSDSEHLAAIKGAQTKTSCESKQSTIEEKKMGYYKKPYPKASEDPNQKKRGRPGWNPNYKKSTVVPGSQYKPITTLSPEQNDIIDAIVNGNGSVMVDAYAGCGKTATCAEAMHRVVKVNPRTSQSYIIFAKRNAEEAIGKCPASVYVKTAHAFGLAALGAAKGKITVDKEKTMRIATALIGADDEQAEVRWNLSKAIDLGKDYLATTTEEIVAIMDKHSLDECMLSKEEFAEKTLKGMATSVEQTNVVSFSDMIYLPLMLNVQIPTFNILYTDECQDLNKARIELVFRALGKNGRLCAVGDEKQSIFGFSGADRHALKILKDRSNAANLPLHTTFRCGRKIVEMAQRYVPDYIAAPSCPEGEVVDVSEQFMLSDEGARAGDAILSRTNAPTVKIAMQLLKAGKRCNIQGRDIGSGLLFMIKRSGAVSVSGFQSWLEEWKNAEIERLTAKKKDYEYVVDKCDCLESFCEGQRDLEGVKAKIKDMFADETDASKIVLSTVHRFKGLERERVFRLEKSFVCRPKTEEDIQQEKNVEYVSCTRSKDSLFLVS